MKWLTPVLPHLAVVAGIFWFRNAWVGLLGFHAFILMSKTRPGSILFSLTMLVLAGWFWRQLAREDQGLLVPVLGHMAADFTILMTVYRMST